MTTNEGRRQHHRDVGFTGIWSDRRDIEQFAYANEAGLALAIRDQAVIADAVKSTRQDKPDPSIKVGSYPRNQIQWLTCSGV